MAPLERRPPTAGRRQIAEKCAPRAQRSRLFPVETVAGALPARPRIEGTMTTAPDLPLAPEQPRPASPALIPYPTEPELPRPLLTVVPDQSAPDEAIALDEALGRAAPRLKRYAARRLRDDHEAEEVVQEALLRAFQHRHLLATEDDLMAWLTVVTGRLGIDRLRVRGRSMPVAEVPPQSQASRDTADVVVARDEARLALD